MQPSSSSIPAPRKPLVVTCTVPLCPRRCGFCDLPICEDSSAITRQRYARALLTEIDAMSEELDPYEVQAIRFTGGAANHLGPEVLASIVGFLSERARVAPACEVSVGCAPTGVSIGLLEQLQHRWRVRLEVEFATSDALLHQNLGRWFAAGAVRDAAAVASSVRAVDLDLDVLYGLEGQGIPALQASIDTAAQLGAHTLSLKPLRLTPGTSVAAAYLERQKKPSSSPRHQFPDASKQRALYGAALDRLQELGYRRYTQHHFAHEGHEAQRVLLACSGADMMGFGAGAHSCYEGVSCINTTDVERYIEGSGDFRRIMASSGPTNESRERWIRGLFGIDGVDPTAAGTFDGKEALVEELTAIEQLEKTPDGRLRLTSEGGFHWAEIRDRLRA